MENLIIEINQKELSEIIKKVKYITSKKTNYSILANVCINVLSDTKIKITASNIENNINYTINAKMKNYIEPTSFAIDQKMLSNILEKFKTIDYIILEIQNNMIIHISSEKKKTSFDIISYNTEDYPKIEVYNYSENSIQFSNVKLYTMLEKLKNFISIDNIKYTLSGLYFKFSKNKIILCSIDGRRLGKFEYTTIEDHNLEYDYIMSIDTVNILIENLKNTLNEKYNVSMYLANGRVYISFKNIEIISVTVVGKFPNYALFIPASTQYEISFSKQEIINAINEISFFTNSDSNQIILQTCNNNLSIIANNSEYGSGKSEIHCTSNFDTEIGFHYKLFIELLKTIDSDNLTMRYNNNLSQMTFNDNDYICIIMPMKIQDN